MRLFLLQKSFPRCCICLRVQTSSSSSHKWLFLTDKTHSTRTYVLSSLLKSASTKRSCFCWGSALQQLARGLLTPSSSRCCQETKDFEGVQIISCVADNLILATFSPEAPSFSSTPLMFSFQTVRRLQQNHGKPRRLILVLLQGSFVFE